MSPILTLGSRVRDRYIIQQQLAQKQGKYTYLVEDQVYLNEHYVLTQLVAAVPKVANWIGHLSAPALQILMEFKHPCIQQIKDYFWEENQIFILQEYVEGRPYQELLQFRTHLTEPEALEILNHLLPALQNLHQRNIVHGNISSQTIVLKNATSTPVLTEFGIIAKIQEYLSLDLSQAEAEQTIVPDRLLRLNALSVPTGIRQDLQDLAVAILVLLTGQVPANLFDPKTSTWNWERWVLLSDQLTQALNQMLSSSEAISADAIMQILRSNLPIRPSVPQNQSSSVLPISGLHLAPSSNAEASTGELTRAILTGGIIGFSILLGALILKTQFPGFLSSTSRSSPSSIHRPIQSLPSPSQNDAPRFPTSPDVVETPQVTPALPSVSVTPPSVAPVFPQPLPTPIASAPEPVPNQTVNSTNATIVGEPGSKNIRSGPGTVYAVKHIAYPGDRVRLIESRQDAGGYRWYRVYSPQSGVEGWIAAQLIDAD